MAGNSNTTESLMTLVRELIKQNTYCEDNKLYIKSTLKYDLYNLFKRYDKEFIKSLEEELEYEGDE